MNKKLALLLGVFIIILSNLSFAAILHGSVYDIKLRAINNVIIEVNSSPSQIFVSKEGQYSFVLEPGDYAANENVSISRNGYFVRDLVLESKEGTAPPDDVNKGKDGNFLYIIIIILIVLMLTLVFIFYRFARKTKKNGAIEKIPEDKKESERNIRLEINGGSKEDGGHKGKDRLNENSEAKGNDDHGEYNGLENVNQSGDNRKPKKVTGHEGDAGPEVKDVSVVKDGSGVKGGPERITEKVVGEVEGNIQKSDKINRGEDPYIIQVLDVIKSEDGRTTQKNIRKKIPLSEAKISLIITELEEQGKVKKIKKGRGNIIILNKE